MMILVWSLSVTFVAGQEAYRVLRGSVKEYKVDKPAGESSYLWQIFTDVSLTTPATSDKVELNLPGPGRENEVRVNWKTIGSYYLLVSVTGDNGCSNRMAWPFIVDPTSEPPIAKILGAPVITIGNCNTSEITLDASTSSGNNLIYNWSPSVYLDDASSSKPKFLPGKSTRYLLTVTDIEGQKDTTSVLVSIADAPLAVTDKNVFVNSPNETILLNGAKSTGTGLTYLWLSNEGIIVDGETKPTALVSGLGTYYLNITDQFGCTSRDSVNVGLYIQAGDDTISTRINEKVAINVLRNDKPRNSINLSSISIVTLPLHGNASVSADSVITYTPDQYYTGQDDFVYQVCDYFENCDQAKVLVLINDLPFFIPEAFSPNGDGINDQFEIKGLAKYQTVEMEIFNRWGNIVFQSKNYGNGPGKEGFWDGTAKNGVRIGSGPVASGTYYFILTLNGNEKISRSIYLDR